MHHVTSLHAKAYLIIDRVHTCVAVTCYLLFYQNDRDLLRATALTRRRRGGREGRGRGVGGGGGGGGKGRGQLLKSEVTLCTAVTCCNIS